MRNCRPSKKVSAMQLKNPVLDDIARLTTGALGAASGIKDEAEAVWAKAKS